MKSLKLNATQWLKMGMKMGYLDKVSQVSDQLMGAGQETAPIAPVQQQGIEQATAPIPPTPKGANADDLLRIAEQIKAVQSKLVATHKQQSKASGILMKYKVRVDSLIKQKAIEKGKIGQEAVVAKLQLDIEKTWAGINELKGMIRSLKQNFDILMKQYEGLQGQLKQLQ